MSKILKNVFGHRFQNKVVWKLLLQNPCLNSVFWNVLGADFKQQIGVSSGTSVIKLNTLKDPPDQLFWIFVSSLYSHLFTPQTQIPGTKKITQSELTHLHNSSDPTPFHLTPHGSSAINPNSGFINASKSHTPHHQ